MIALATSRASCRALSSRQSRRSSSRSAVMEDIQGAAEATRSDWVSQFRNLGRVRGRLLGSVDSRPRTEIT